MPLIQLHSETLHFRRGYARLTSNGDPEPLLALVDEAGAAGGATGEGEIEDDVLRIAGAAALGPSITMLLFDADVTVKRDHHTCHIAGAFVQGTLESAAGGGALRCDLSANALFHLTGLPHLDAVAGRRLNVIHEHLAGAMEVLFEDSGEVWLLLPPGRHVLTLVRERHDEPQRRRIVDVGQDGAAGTESL